MQPTVAFAAVAERGDRLGAGGEDLGDRCLFARFLYQGFAHPHAESDRPGADIVEHVGLARVVHTDFPLGNPCGEPHQPEQQRAILEMGFKLLEHAFSPRTTVQTPFRWSEGDAWKARVFTQAQPWKSGEVEQDWLRRKEHYRKLKAEGKV